MNDLNKWLTSYWQKFGNNKKAFIYRDNLFLILEEILKINNIPYIVSDISESSQADFIKAISQKNTISISSLPKENIILGNYKKYSRDDLDIFIFKNFYSSELQSWISKSHVAIVDSSDEWVAREQEASGILSSDPVKNKAWLRYTKAQREAVLKHFAIYQQNEHKRLFKIHP